MDGLALFTEELRRFVAERDWQKFHDPKNLSMLLASEVGELLALLRWVGNAEADAFAADAAARARLADEIADVGISLLLLCDRLELDLVEVMRAKLALNRSRYPAELVRGRADIKAPTRTGE